MDEQSPKEKKDNKTLFIRQTDPKDGYVECIISDDQTSISASFYPPGMGGAFITYPLVSERLAEYGITTGINHDLIQETIFLANSSHSAQKNVLIVHNPPPKDEIPEHFVIKKDFLERKPEIDPDAARVDWHTISAFSIVKKKDPIARRIPKVEGIPGNTIFGEELAFVVRSMPMFSAGDNVIDHPTGLFAGKDGRLSIDTAGKISIEEVLVLKKGVDFSTGNITFPGDVVINGKVADGFKVYSGGSIVCSDVLDATEIVCKKDLVVQAGIEGKTKGAIRVGGNLTAKYIQNCRVAVRGDVLVTGSIVQSTVYSMGMIKMGETGKLVGCECIVITGVQALDIGSPRGAKTRIRCGTDFIVQQELDIANEQLKVLAVKIQQTEEEVAENPNEKNKLHLEKLKAKKNEINARIPAYLPKIDTNDQAFVEVHGSIYPGAEIEICHVNHEITAVQKQVIFKLDKLKGCIISEPLAKGSSSAKPSAQKKD